MRYTVWVWISTINHALFLRVAEMDRKFYAFRAVISMNPCERTKKPCTDWYVMNGEQHIIGN